jgi:hypothetical protein
MISNLYRYKVPNQPKSSAADVYAVIIKDLTDAETLLATLVGIIKVV